MEKRWKVFEDPPQLQDQEIHIWRLNLEEVRSQIDELSTFSLQIDYFYNLSTGKCKKIAGFLNAPCYAVADIANPISFFIEFAYFFFPFMDGFFIVLNGFLIFIV